MIYLGNRRMSNISGLTRSRHPADRCLGILEQLRARIVRGEFRPGMRLPTRRHLAAEYKTTLVPVQKALSRLEAAGFVRSRVGDGSYVADKPPHLFRYGILFSQLPTLAGEQWYFSKYWSMLARFGHQAALDHDLELVCYSGVSDWTSAEDARRLQADVEGARLAGVIASMPLDAYAPVTELLAKHRIPVVQIAAKPTVPTHHLKLNSPYEMVIARLRQAGCRRLSLLVPQFLASADVDRIVSLARAAGIAICESDIMGIDPREQRWVRNWIRLLMRSDSKPQTLWITDDNLVDQAALGLSDAGVLAGRDLQAVAHANFPLEQPGPTGFIRYGVDLRVAMETCLRLLKQRAPDPTNPVASESIDPQWMSHS
jgi:DNA-binding LacI/PurR family transcriptional regulator